MMPRSNNSGEIGIIDLSGVMRVLRELSYDGPVICEPFEPSKTRLAAMPVEEALAEAGGAMARVMAES